MGGGFALKTARFQKSRGDGGRGSGAKAKGKGKGKAPGGKGKGGGKTSGNTESATGAGNNSDKSDKKGVESDDIGDPGQKAQQLEAQADALRKLGASEASVASLRKDVQAMRKLHISTKSPEQLEKGCVWALEKKREAVKKAEANLANIAKEQELLDKKRIQEESYLSSRKEAVARLEQELEEIRATKPKVEARVEPPADFAQGISGLMPNVDFQEPEAKQLLEALVVLQKKAAEKAAEEAKQAEAAGSAGPAAEAMDTGAKKTIPEDDDEDMFFKVPAEQRKKLGGSGYTDEAMQKFAAAHGLAVNFEEKTSIARLQGIMELHEQEFVKRRRTA